MIANSGQATSLMHPVLSHPARSVLQQVEVPLPNRLQERHVFEDKTLPPDILFLGDRHNHDEKCFSSGQLYHPLSALTPLFYD